MFKKQQITVKAVMKAAVFFTVFFELHLWLTIQFNRLNNKSNG